ncbi:hypothetical protein [Nonlabens xiamenensis]|uniref:hypothetical protein n=1 Tax=Nonlabens xiamenensis TaxID=2341043 RepID=UPI000F60A3C7|nr:hypothetical protein [Nonlabens xiamenensis]
MKYTIASITLICFSALTLVVNEKFGAKTIEIWGQYTPEADLARHEIDVDDFETYNDFLEALSDIDCNNKTPIILLRDQNITYHIQPMFHNCKRLIYCGRSNRYIQITSDFIYIDEPVQFGRLTEENMYTFFQETFRKEPYFLTPQKPRYSNLHFVFNKDQTIEVFREILLLAVKAYVKIKDQHDGEVPFNAHFSFPIPPPRPPSLLIETS